MSQFHTVIRPFESDRQLCAGEVVDVSTWRTARSLVERRFIRPATAAEIEAATAPEEVSTIGPSDIPAVARSRKAVLDAR